VIKRRHTDWKRWGEGCGNQKWTRRDKLWRLARVVSGRKSREVGNSGRRQKSGREAFRFFDATKSDLPGPEDIITSWKGLSHHDARIETAKETR